LPKHANNLCHPILINVFISVDAISAHADWVFGGHVVPRGSGGVAISSDKPSRGASFPFPFF